MKIAVISDIHANLEALQAALNYLHDHQISRIICLGDVVGYGPRPNECVELVKRECAVCLMGNHDHAVLGLTDIQDFNEFARTAVLWTRRAIAENHRGELRKYLTQYEENQVLYVHSTPVEPLEWNYIFSVEDARRNLNEISQRLVFVGHSHIPVIFSEHEGAFLEAHFQLDLDQDRYVVNVGSVGQPRDGDPRLCFVIFDDEALTLQYVRLDYPVQKTYQEILDQHLPSFLALRLLAGH